MDFFGNVQNVEVDGVGDYAGNDTEWKEDLLALGRKIADLREKAEKEEMSETVNGSTSQPRDVPMTKIRAAKVEVDDGWFGKRAVGAWMLAGCALAWAAGSYLEGGS